MWGLALGLRRDLSTAFGELADAIGPLLNGALSHEEKKEAIACLTTNASPTLFDGYAQARAEMSSLQKLLRKQYHDVDTAHERLAARYPLAPSPTPGNALLPEPGQSTTGQ